MLQVNNEYLSAINSLTRKERVKGTIKLKGTGETLQISDENIVRGSLSVDERICSGKYEIGTFNANQMKLAILDRNALGRDFSNAVIKLDYGIMLGNGNYYNIALGLFCVDGNSVKRRRDRVYLTGYDYSVRFDKEKIESENKSVYDTLKFLCTDSGVVLETTENEILSFPNSDMEISLSDSQLQTNRDCVMWIAALLGCYARINRYGRLEIKKPVYKTLETDNTVILTDWEITGNERTRTVFTDTRTFVKHMTGYSAGKVKSYVSNRYIIDTQAEDGFLALPQNPLMKGLSESEADSANQKICNSIAELMQRGIEADIFGNPAMECGDAVKLSGGAIDLSRRIIGIITRRTWRYRQGEKIICNNPVAWKPEEVDTDDSVAKKASVAPKSQTEKRIDSISSKEALKPINYFLVSQSGFSYKVNEKEYGIVKDEDGFIMEIFDNNDNVFYPDLKSKNAVDAEKFNALILPLVFARGIKGNKKKNDNFVTRWNLNAGTDGTMLKILSQPGSFNCRVDWGDGNVSEHVSGNLTHQYSEIPSDGIVTVNISGHYNGICMGDSASSSSVRLEEVVNWGDVGFTCMKDAFRGCSNLKKLPNSPLTGAENVINFSYAFSNIAVHFPDYFFSNCSNAVSFEGVFSGSGSKINSTFGKGLFKGCKNAVNFMNAFLGISSMTVDNEMFSGCSNAQNFKKCFGGSYAGVLNIDDKVFKDCVNISSMENVMGYCHTYTISPSWFNLESFLGRSVNFLEAFTAFNSQANVSGTAPDLWNYTGSGSSASSCFMNCVNLINYGSIPSEWR